MRKLCERRRKGCRGEKEEGIESVEAEKRDSLKELEGEE